NPSTPIVTFKASWPGAGFANPGDTDYGNFSPDATPGPLAHLLNMIDQWPTFLTALGVAGYSVGSKRCVCIGAETDANIQADSLDTQDNIEAAFAALRTATVLDASTPIAMPRVRNSVWPYGATTRAQQWLVAEADAYVQIINTDGLTLHDGIHFAEASVTTLASRCYEALDGAGYTFDPAYMTWGSVNASLTKSNGDKTITRNADTTGSKFARGSQAFPAGVTTYWEADRTVASVSHPGSDDGTTFGICTEDFDTTNAVNNYEEQSAYSCGTGYYYGADGSPANTALGTIEVGERIGQKINPTTNIHSMNKDGGSFTNYDLANWDDNAGDNYYFGANVYYASSDNVRLYVTIAEMDDLPAGCVPAFSY
ncbi:MAG: hypothetical protein Q8R82_19325, partial [Hyphomonadaceae bacterium]|nr:hypothetical protein [Hyphomonadaceae bacterium]